jgi:hypothetical protein
MQSLDLEQMQECDWTWVTLQGENVYGRYRVR